MAEGMSDLRMQQFLMQEGQRQKFQQAVHSLTEQCWETCIFSTGQRLERKQETCLVNCVQRFLDISGFVVNRLEKEGEATIAYEQKKRSSAATPEFKWQ